MKQKRTNIKTFLRLSAFGGAVGFAVILLYISQPYFIVRLGNNIYDLYLRNSKKPSPAANLAVIDIDEESLAEIGQWPWSRYLIAEMMSKLYEAGVLSVGVDIILSEPDRTSPELINERLKSDFGLDASISGVPEELKNYDQYLAERIKGTNTVLAFFARYEAEERLPEKLPKTFTVIERTEQGAVPPQDLLPGATDASFPIEILSSSANIGFTNAGGDADGVVRSVPLAVKVKNRIYPSLALAALMKARGVRNIILTSDPGGLKSLTVGKTEVPIGANADFWVPFAGGRGSYPYYKAKDVLSGAAGEAELKDKIVIMGSSAVGLLDIRTTPLEPFYPGVELHLAIIDAIENGRSIVIPPYEPALQLTAILLAAFFSSFLFGLLRPSVYLPAGVLLCAALLFFTGAAFAKGVYLSPLYVVLTVFFSGGILVCVRFWQEESHKRFIKNAFGHYVAPEVVDKIALREDDFLSGQKRELTILFSDLRGFTSISESLDPNLVVRLLNDYFTPMTAIVRNSGGTLDKFIGDALMAFWNAPLDVPNHALKAVGAATAMQNSLTVINGELHKIYGITLKMGIGIHSGGAYVGNMGSEDMVNYTIIGDNVNLASRLEGLSKTYGQNILLSEDTMNACGDCAWRFLHLDSIRVKGKQNAVDIYAPLSVEEYKKQEVELNMFSEGRLSYVSGDFTKAAKVFEKLTESYPDKPLFTLYYDRIKDLLQTPPESWDGSWTFVTK
jgi:adenylate cyclase